MFWRKRYPRTKEEHLTKTKYPPWPLAPWWKVLGKSWWFQRVPQATAYWCLRTSTRPARSSFSPMQWTFHSALDMPPDFPAAEKTEEFLNKNAYWLPKFWPPICWQSRYSCLTSRILAYCSFSSSSELETFLAVSFSRFSKALASDCTESRLTLRTKCKTSGYTSVTGALGTN